MKFKHYMGTDKVDFNRTVPAYPMYYDYTNNYMKDRDFWLKLILGMMLVSYGVKRINLERDRARQTARIEGYQNYPAHHFNNRGGVIVRKQFIGFEKYHASSDDYMTWLNLAYPKGGEE